MKFNTIAFGQLIVTGGGRIILQGVDIRIRRLLFQNLQTLRKPYRIYGDFLLTQSDIVNSKLIRNLIQLLVNTILEKVMAQASGVLKVSVNKVTIRDRRLHAQGEVEVVSSTGLGIVPPITYEVSTGAQQRDSDKHIVYLNDIRVVLNPDSALRTVFPILLNTPIDIDLGNDCCIENLIIGNHHVLLRAVAVISPVAPFAVAEQPRKAMYKYDLAALLSSILTLPGGLALKAWA